MPFRSQKAALILSPEQRQELERIVGRRTERVQRVERAKMLLAYAEGKTISEIARTLGTNRPKVGRCVNKALQLGVGEALGDLPGRGSKPTITPEAQAWLVSLACRKAKELGYAQELWTTRLLARHVRQHCQEAGHPSLMKISSGTVSKILSRQPLRPHKVRYYVERRDPDFEQKMAQVLCVYKEVDLLREQGPKRPEGIAVLCYDEKPGIQALETTGVELPPVPVVAAGLRIRAPRHPLPVGGH